ncbi:hypothetical protein [Streptomyces cyaneofuscatus]
MLPTTAAQPPSPAADWWWSAGSSAAQIAAELAVTARVTLATRGPV